jgi:hypothetical protein
VAAAIKHDGEKERAQGAREVQMGTWSNGRVTEKIEAPLKSSRNEDLKGKFYVGFFPLGHQK